GNRRGRSRRPPRGRPRSLRGAAESLPRDAPRPLRVVAYRTLAFDETPRDDRTLGCPRSELPQRRLGDDRGLVFSEDVLELLRAPHDRVVAGELVGVAHPLPLLAQRMELVVRGIVARLLDALAQLRQLALRNAFEGRVETARGERLDLLGEVV